MPKPWTPFQWDPMEPIATLRGKAQAPASGRARRMPNLQLDIESPREAYLQTILSRGDRRVARFLEAVHAADGDWWRVIRAWQRDGLAGAPHPDAYVHRTYGEDELLRGTSSTTASPSPTCGSSAARRSAARQTAPCDTSTCRSCAAC